MWTKTINLRRGAFGQPSVPFLLSRRAHLLTTRRWRAVVSLPLVGIVRSPRGMRLLRQPYGQCHTSEGSAVIVHAVGALLTAEVAALFVQQYVPTAIEKLPPEDFRCYGYRPGDAHFLFRKKKQKRGRRDGENEWQSITWKRKL